MITLVIISDVMSTGLVTMLYHSRNLHISTLTNIRWDARKTAKLFHHNVENIQRDLSVQMSDAHVTIILQNRKYPVLHQMVQVVWFLHRIGLLVSQAIISCHPILTSTLKNQKKTRHSVELSLWSKMPRTLTKTNIFLAVKPCPKKFTSKIGHTQKLIENSRAKQKSVQMITKWL